LLVAQLSTSEIIAIIGLGIGAVGIPASLFGVWLGSRLSENTALAVLKKQQEFADRQLVRQRRDDAAAELDRSVTDVMKQTPFGTHDVREIEARCDAARSSLHDAWQRSTVVKDQEIDDRVWALSMALHFASGDAQAARILGARQREAPTVNLWPVHVAFGDVRKALEAFLHHREPPPAEFPPVGELVGLAHPGGQNEGLEGIRKWLLEHGVT
jgi:hypothetical protein